MSPPPSSSFQGPSRVIFHNSRPAPGGWQEAQPWRRMATDWTRSSSLKALRSVRSVASSIWRRSRIQAPSLARSWHRPAPTLANSSGGAFNLTILDANRDCDQDWPGWPEPQQRQTRTHRRIRIALGPWGLFVCLGLGHCATAQGGIWLMDSRGCDGLGPLDFPAIRTGAIMDWSNYGLEAP